MPARARTVLVEILMCADGLDGPGAAACDLLRMINALAALRGQRRPPVTWRWVGTGRRNLPRPQAVPTSRQAADVVLVQGWPARNGPHLDRLVAREARLAAHLQEAHAAGAHVMGLFTGVALLGAAGLLAGRKACMPWAFLASMLRMAPEVCPSDSAWVSDQRVWTADSPAQTTALLLEVLAACGLTHLVDALRPVVLHTPDRQRLLKAVAQDARSRLGPGSLERARQWLEEHLHEPYSLEATAQAASTSTRSLLRHFKATFGQSPLSMLHQMRITRARMLLETTYLPVEAVAERCGWRDTAMLRTVFRRATGLTPAAYRERYRLRTHRREWGQDLRGSGSARATDQP